MKTLALKSIALGVVVALLAIASVMRFHHHKDDGSVCLCLSVVCHSQHHDLDNCCTHNHGEESSEDDCGQNIDDFRDVNKQPDCMPSVSFVAIFSALFEIDVYENLGHSFIEGVAPSIVPKPMDGAVWRRGPPSDIV